MDRKFLSENKTEQYTSNLTFSVWATVKLIYLEECAKEEPCIYIVPFTAPVGQTPARGNEIREGLRCCLNNNELLQQKQPCSSGSYPCRWSQYRIKWCPLWLWQTRHSHPMTHGPHHPVSKPIHGYSEPLLDSTHLSKGRWQQHSLQTHQASALCPLPLSSSSFTPIIPSLTLGMFLYTNGYYTNEINVFLYLREGRFDSVTLTPLKTTALSSHIIMSW